MDAISMRIALLGWIALNGQISARGKTTVFARCATRTRHHLNRNPNMQNKQ
jgi:hypothetical protein